jgi:hypothetical protein
MKKRGTKERASEGGIKGIARASEGATSLCERCVEEKVARLFVICVKEANRLLVCETKERRGLVISLSINQYFTRCPTTKAKKSIMPQSDTHFLVEIEC